MFLKRPAVFSKTFKTKGKSTSRERIRAPRPIPGARSGVPSQGTTRQEGIGPLLAAQVRERRSAPSTRTEQEERNIRNTLENQRGNSVRPRSVAGTMAPSRGRDHRTTLAVPRSSRSTSGLTGTVIMNSQLPLPKGAQEAVKKQCTLPEPQ